MNNTSFENITIDQLESLGDEGRDALSFGVVGFDRETVVDAYNALESEMSGLAVRDVMGAPFFEATAQCMNNFMVAQRFEDESELDAVIPYVLTLRMRPTPVRMRLLATASIVRRYILIQR
jgi:photoactive yellow protein